MTAPDQSQQDTRAAGRELSETLGDEAATREPVPQEPTGAELLAELDSSVRAPLVEIFTSIQGEGLFAGLQQVFVRFAGCDLGCPWCDTPEALHHEGDCWCQTRPGVRGYSIANPARVQDAAEAVRRIVEADEERAIHSISLTGGEPLMHPEFVAALAATLRELELPIMLETNGQRPGDLQRVLRAIDWVAADFKLDSAMGRPIDAEARREFLRLAQQKRAFVKIVVTEDATEEEMTGVFEQLADIDPGCPVFLQPVTPVNDVRPPTGLDLIRFRAIALRRLRDVRVMPQIHRALGLR